MDVIGISLVRNEERFVEQALTNALQLCDRIIALDHLSEDDTGAIVCDLARRTGRVERRTVERLSETHAHVEEFVGTDTWVFGVDGDELWDPGGLAMLRRRLLTGEFERNWMVRGHFCHVKQLGPGWATGWMAPPSHDPSKLYNMAMVRSWRPETGALFHAIGIEMHNRGGYFADHRPLNRETGWRESPLRCLHMRFLPRSRADAGIDRLRNPRGMPYDLVMGIPARRRTKYQQGPLVSVPTGAFGLSEETVAWSRGRVPA